MEKGLGLPWEWERDSWVSVWLFNLFCGHVAVFLPISVCLCVCFLVSA